MKLKSGLEAGRSHVTETLSLKGAPMAAQLDGDEAELFDLGYRNYEFEDLDWGGQD